MEGHFELIYGWIEKAKQENTHEYPSLVEVARLGFDTEENCVRLTGSPSSTSNSFPPWCITKH